MTFIGFRHAQYSRAMGSLRISLLAQSIQLQPFLYSLQWRQLSPCHPSFPPGPSCKQAPLPSTFTPRQWAVLKVQAITIFHSEMLPSCTLLYFALPGWTFHLPVSILKATVPMPFTVLIHTYLWLYHQWPAKSALPNVCIIARCSCASVPTPTPFICVRGE